MLLHELHLSFCSFVSLRKHSLARNTIPEEYNHGVLVCLLEYLSAFCTLARKTAMSTSNSNERTTLQNSNDAASSQQRDRVPHTHGDPSSVGSPSHLSSLHAGFSPEDIQELLGGVLEDDHTGSAASNGVPDDVKAAARSERKRSREKQRRSDVNKQFATLTDLLRQIEGGNTDLFATPVWTEASFSPTNRVELMARTIHVLQALDRSHKKQKTRVRELEQQLEQAQKAGEEAAAKAKEKMMAPMQAGQNQVVMMVPMLLPGGGAAPGSAPAAAAAHPQMAFMPTMGGDGMPAAASMPWMMPHPMAPWGMQMPTAATPAAVSTTNNAPAPLSSTATPSEESKQPPASENATTSNLAHCA